MSEESITLVEDVGQPVKYTVLEKSLVGNEIFEEGQTCQYAGLPSENLAPQCDIGRARYQKYLATNAARVAAMKEGYAETNITDPAAFAAAVAKAIADSRKDDDDRIAKIVAAAFAERDAAKTDVSKKAPADLA